MDLEKYKDALAEYLEEQKKGYIKLHEEGVIPDEIFEHQLERHKQEIIKFLENNEAYGQVILDMSHIKSKDLQMYSLTEIARKKNPENPSYVIQSWLRDRNTLELLRLWEKEHNRLQFNDAEAVKLIERTKDPKFTLTAKIWIKETHAGGIKSKQGNNGGTFAQHEIAIDFITWLFPEKRYQLSKMISNRILMLEE